jgi:hypothetical protein
LSQCWKDGGRPRSATERFTSVCVEKWRLENRERSGRFYNWNERAVLRVERRGESRGEFLLCKKGTGDLCRRESPRPRSWQARLYFHSWVGLRNEEAKRTTRGVSWVFVKNHDTPKPERFAGSQNIKGRGFDCAQPPKKVDGSETE